MGGGRDIIYFFCQYFGIQVPKALDIGHKMAAVPMMPYLRSVELKKINLIQIQDI